jgi:hypothetical protein
MSSAHLQRNFCNVLKIVKKKYMFAWLISTDRNSSSYRIPFLREVGDGASERIIKERCILSYEFINQLCCWHNVGPSVTKCLFCIHFWRLSKKKYFDRDKMPWIEATGTCKIFILRLIEISVIWGKLLT